MKKGLRLLLALFEIIIGVFILGVSDRWIACAPIFLFALLQLISFVIDGELDYYVYQLQKENEKYNEQRYLRT